MKYYFMRYIIYITYIYTYMCACVCVCVCKGYVNITRVLNV